MPDLKPKTILAYTTLILHGISAIASQVSPNAMQWHKVTLTFEGPTTSEKAEPNPFLDYRLNTTFTGPSGQVIEVPGFFAADGNAAETGANKGNLWQVRFTPDEPGEWSYSVSFIKGPGIAVSKANGDSAGYFDGESGEFSVEPTRVSPDSKDFRGKGKLEYVGEHFLRFRGNGEYFLKIGANSPEVFLEYREFDNTSSNRSYENHIQDWKTDDPAWRNGLGKGIIGAVNYLASLDNNVVYFLTMNRFGDGKQAWPFINDTAFMRYDCSKLDQWNIVFEHMNAMGVMVHFVLTETENESFFESVEDGFTGGFADSRKLYYREMVARFGYLPAVTWNIGEENGWAEGRGDHTVRKAITTEQRKQFADYLRGLTYYEDSIVVHNGPDEDYHIFEKPNDNILGHKSFTGPSLQGDYVAGNIYKDVLKFRNLSAETGHPWVVTMDEPFIAEPTGDLEVWRKENVWATFMAGGAGIELYIGKGSDLTVEDLREFEPYYRTMQIAHNFFMQHVPFWELEPSESFVDEGWTLMKPEAFYLIYFADAVETEIVLPSPDFDTQWFSPVNGSLSKGPVPDASGALHIKSPWGEKDDSVLIIKRHD